MASQVGGAPPVSFDFNNDGSSDFPVSIIGYDSASPASGAARIWSGASKAIIHTVLPADANTLFGWSVGSAGDLNADGFDDLVVGEPLWGPNGTLEGRVHVFSGADASELLTIPGFYPETALGRFVTGIGDWNGDGIVDMLDIQLVLEGYGEQTDIYTGLWDGSRLLAVVGGSAGFGSIGTGPVSGAWGEGPGITPIGNCWRSSPPPPPDDGPGMVPTLLRGDARANCATCPACDEPDPGDCYECDKKGKIVGGDITATVQEPNPNQPAEQPLPGQTVCFTWEPFTVEGRKEKCKAACGDEGTECPISMQLCEIWTIEKRIGDSNVWDVIKSSGDPGNPEPCTTQEACAEIRFVLLSCGVPGVDRCETLQPVQKEKAVQFAPFTLDWLCYAPRLNNHRSTIGLGETVEVWVVEPNAGTADWSATSNFTISEHPTTAFLQAIGPGPAEVTATINGCSRKLPFEIKLPTVNYTKCPLSVGHHQGQIDLKFALWMDLDPDTVSFTNVEVREVAGPAVNVTGFFLQEDTYHAASIPIVPDSDNVFRPERDIVQVNYPLQPGFGGFEWQIPVEVRVLGRDDWFSIGTVQQTFTLDDTCLTITKQGQSETRCRDQPTEIPQYPDCPPPRN